MSGKRDVPKSCSVSVTGTWKVRFEWLSSPRTRVFGKLECGSGVDTARWWETDLTRTVLEWLCEDLHGRKQVKSPAVQATGSPTLVRNALPRLPQPMLSARGIYG